MYRYVRNMDCVVATNGVKACHVESGNKQFAFPEYCSLDSLQISIYGPSQWVYFNRFTSGKWRHDYSGHAKKDVNKKYETSVKGVKDTETKFMKIKTMSGKLLSPIWLMTDYAR